MRNVVKASCVVLLVGMLAACGGDDERQGFEAGPLGAVEVDASEAVQIRSLLAHIAVPSIAEWSRYSIELAVEDFGSIHGHNVELGEPIDTMCSPRRRARRRRAGHRRFAGGGRHRHLVLGLGSGGFTTAQRRRTGDDLADQHLTCAHLRSRRQRGSRLPPRLFPHRQQRPLSGAGGRGIRLP